MGQARHAAGRVKQLFVRDIPHATWRAWSRARYGETRPVRLAGGERLTVRTDDFRSFRIAQLHGTQPEKIDVWRRLAAMEPAVAVDVGANYGEFSLALVRTGVPVIAVEPNPDLQPCLASTFAAQPGVTVVWAAAADRPGTVRLYANPRSSGSASLAPLSPEQERRSQRRRGVVAAIDVPSVRLTDLVAERAGTVDSMILKVDVEGFELDVLAGARELLEGLRWWRALVEFGPGPIVAAGGDPAATWAELRQFQGVVVSAAARGVAVADDAAERACQLGPDEVLPREPPGEVDVVIGAGRAPVPCRT